MRLRAILSFCLAALGAYLLAAPVAAGAPLPFRHLDEEEHPVYTAYFKLEGSNGYRISFFAISERNDGRGRIYVGASRENAFAAYSAPAIVSEAFVRADLGTFGRMDLALSPSGREKTIRIRCSRGETYPFEPATYGGIVEFEGEGGYTRARATEVSASPPITSVCGSGSGYGETSGPGVPGARIRGVSFAHGRKLSFQVNKNHPRSRALFTAEIRERRREIMIYRQVSGMVPAGSFRYDPGLRTALLSPPAPFSGAASLRRSPNSVVPLWGGDLAIEFPGRKVRLAGPGVHVSLVHACFTRSGGPFAESC